VKFGKFPLSPSLSSKSFAKFTRRILLCRFVRFGEDSAQDMVEWAEEHFPQTDGRILDGTGNHCYIFSTRSRSLTRSHSSPLTSSTLSSSTVGTGNGQLLFCFSSAGYTCLTGIDYSSHSIDLAQSILASRTSSATSTSDLNDDQDEDSPQQAALSDPPPTFFVADILDVASDKEVKGVTGEQWDLITDKGTYDAVCLSDETKEGRRLQDLYVESVAKLLGKGGIFLITSCESELRSLLVWSSVE